MRGAKVRDGRTPILVGRDAELDLLRGVLPVVRDGSARVVALSGPAGIGKSRLASEGLQLADAVGYRTLAGAGAALQQDLAYAPMVAALRPLAREPALVDGLPDLGRLFGELGVPSAPALSDPGLERTRLFESVCRLVERACARQPIALLVDDVHWADRGSLSLLQYLVRGLAAQPLLVALTYRADEASPSLTGLLTDLRRSGELVELPVGGLADPAVAALAADLLGGDAPAGLLEMLAGRSGGVPLFVRALVGSLADSGALRQDSGGWTLAPRPAETVPAEVSELVGSRIERLSEDARAVLELIAVGGGQTEHAVLRSLLADQRLLAGIAALRRAQLVSEEVVDGSVCYRVTHPLLAEVAYTQLPLVARRRRHGEMARAVREHLPDRLGLLAQHVRHAGDEIDPDEALQVLDRAADEALTRKGGDEALTHLDAARTLAQRLDRTDLLAELLDRTAQAYELVGDRERTVALWQLAAAHRTGDLERGERLQRAAQREVEEGRYEHTERLVAEAAACLGRVTPGPVHVRLAVTRQHAAFRWERADDIEEVMAQLRDLARQLDLPEAWLAVHAGGCHAAFFRGHYAESRAHVPALLKVADELSDEIRERARRLPFGVELAWGDLRSAARIAGDALTYARRTGVPSLQRSALTNVGVAAYHAGDWTQALNRCDEVIELGQRIAAPRATVSGLPLRALILLRRGRLEAALECVAQARAVAVAAGLTDRHALAPIEHVEALAALTVGDPAAAEALVTDLTSGSWQPGIPATTLAGAQLASGRADAAAATADRLAAMGPAAPYPGALADWIRGRACGDPQLVARGADELAALGFVYEAAVAGLDFAELAGVAPTDQCLRVLERVDARPQLDRARKLSRAQGRRAAPPRPSPGPLSAREEQVARLVAEGLSNPEIAARLYLSTRTVTTHLQNIYRRLGVGSRAALVRYVIEHPPPNT